MSTPLFFYCIAIVVPDPIPDYIGGEYDGDVLMFLEERDLLNDYSSKIVSSTVEKNSLELERFELVRSIRKSVSSFHDNRRSSVGFLDFVYYSFCVSTTVSFGDIAPNNGWTRFIAILELLSCIVLVHFILTGMTKKENE